MGPARAYLRAISAKNFKKTMHARQQNNAETGVTSDRPVLLSFPGGVVKPHEAERWQRSLQSVLVAERLTDVAAGKLTKIKDSSLGIRL